MTLNALSREPEVLPRTLGDLLTAIVSDASLTLRRRQEQRSALRVIARAIGRRPEEIIADPSAIRERVAGLSARVVGVSPGRWANVLSLMRAALSHACLTTIPGRSTVPLTPEWGTLFRFLNDRRLREALSRFARYCGMLGIAPSHVADDTATTFLHCLENGSVVRNPRQVHRTMCQAWNRAAATIPAWPRVRLNVPHYRKDYSLPWETFPPSLLAEKTAYFDRLSGKDLLDEIDFRPLRLTSIKSYDRLLRAFLSALVLRGRDPQSLHNLREVVAIDTFKEGLRFFIERSGGGTTKQTYNIARMLLAVARHWVKVDTDHLETLRSICRRLDCGKTGLTEKNNDRLRPLADPQHAEALLLLPERVFARLKRRKEVTRADALQAQSALMVEILQMIPMRVSNLADLDLERNLLRTRTGRDGLLHVVVPTEDVKNGFALEAELPAESTRLLNVYLERYRPLLLKKPSSYLFPNATGGPKSRYTVSPQIKQFIWRECGLQINPHLFRHIGAKFYLDHHPGAYGLIRLVLGHNSGETAERSYCGTETAAAMRHFDQNVLRLRAQVHSKPKPRRGG